MIRTPQVTKSAGLKRCRIFWPVEVTANLLEHITGQTATEKGILGTQREPRQKVLSSKPECISLTIESHYPETRLNFGASIGQTMDPCINSTSMELGISSSCESSLREVPINTLFL